VTLAEAVSVVLAATTRPFRKATYMLVGYLLPNELTDARDLSESEWDRAEVFGMNLPEVDS
jgi:hypothetical protein